MWMSLSGTFSPVIMMALKQRRNNQVLSFAFFLFWVQAYHSFSWLACIFTYLHSMSKTCKRIRIVKKLERSFNTKVAFPGISGGAPPAPYLLRIVSTNNLAEVRKKRLPTNVWGDANGLIAKTTLPHVWSQGEPPLSSFSHPRYASLPPRNYLERWGGYIS